MTKETVSLEREERDRFRAATFAVVATLILTAGKFFVARLTNSVGVLSEGIHSSLDLLSTLVAFFTIREAIKPADEEHPFGHGKIETLSSLLEALLLVAAAGFIFVEAYEHFRYPKEIVRPELALLVMVFSLVVSFGAYFHNRRAAVATESRAIEVNALHFLADALTSGGVIIAILLIQWTRLTWIDPLIAFLIGIYILLISAPQIWGALQELTDSRLPAEEVAEINDLLKRFSGDIIGIHDLRTRKSGVNRYLEFHLTTCGKQTVEESHRVCDRMEEAILARFPKTSVTIHVEPCGTHEREKGALCIRERNLNCEPKRKT